MTPIPSVNMFWRRLFNGTVYMEFRICFTIAKNENDILSLFETFSKIYSVIDDQNYDQIFRVL